MMRHARITACTIAGTLVVSAGIIFYSFRTFPGTVGMRAGEVVAEALTALLIFAIAQGSFGLPTKPIIRTTLFIGAELFYFGSLLDFLDELLSGPPVVGFVEDLLGLTGLILLGAAFFTFLRHQSNMIRHFERANDRLAEISRTDSLTGLYNSRHFYERLADEIQRAKRYNRTFSLLLFDIDDFKRHNDEFGHLSGDKVLKQLGKIMHEVLREQDTGYRYGGEEFTIILPETDGVHAAVVAERLRKQVEADTFDCNVRKTISIGICEYSPDYDAATIVKRADEAMYAAKRAGKNQIARWSTGL